MQKRGIICAGSWLVDHNKLISHWPAQEELAQVTGCELQGGGPAHNMALDLARLDPLFPVRAIGAIGNDDEGRMLIKACAERGIDYSGMHIVDGLATSSTDVMIDSRSGKRSFFHRQAANALLTPAHFNFEATPARILHLGAPGVHDGLDAPYENDPSGWVTVLKRAQLAGLQTNLEMVSGPAERVRQLVMPCLHHLDTLIINDYEAGILTGIEIVADGLTSLDAARLAATKLLTYGPIALAVIHFPAGCVAATRSGDLIAKPSLKVPKAAIKSANGAGDAFAAGVLYAIHEGWTIDDALSLAFCSAASALRSVSATASVGTVTECLALANAWGWRGLT